MARISKNWWPKLLQWIGEENPTEFEYVTIAEIGNPRAGRYRHLYSALAPRADLQRILSRLGSIGHKVEASGYNVGQKFWIWSGEDSRPLEPIVLAWESANTTVFDLDPVFRMSYGLVPRVEHVTGTVHWDDPKLPLRDIAIVRPKSQYSFPSHSGAFVKVLKSYLTDYAFSREMEIIQVYFADTWGQNNECDLKTLGKKKGIRVNLPGRLIDLRRVLYKNYTLVSQVWGVRHLKLAAESPITDARWDYGTLKWPGIREPVTYESSKHYLSDCVYVKDEVLGEYEGKNEYDICPETGSVSYGGQWSVGFCRRVGRDLIELEIRKLYEGCNPDVVRCWHRYATTRPNQPIARLAHTRNVAIRSRRIVYALINLGEQVAGLASRALRRSISAEQVVGTHRQNADYIGWRNLPYVAPVTEHIPINLVESRFLDRCKCLNNLILEGLSEKILRELAIKVGVKSKEAKSRSLKLLDCILQRVDYAQRVGLRVVADRKIISERLKTEKPFLVTRPLFILNELRIAATHRGTKSKIQEAANELGLTPAVHDSSLGLVLDNFYDKIGEALENMADVFQD